MKKIVASLFVIFFISGCATVNLSEGGKRVRFVGTTPVGCKYLGEVTGSFSNATSGKLIADDDPLDYTEADTKNRAAELGADTLEKVSSNQREIKAEAYKCSNQ